MRLIKELLEMWQGSPERVAGEAKLKHYTIELGVIDFPEDVVDVEKVRAYVKQMIWDFATNQEVETIEDISLSDSGNEAKITLHFDLAPNVNAQHAFQDAWDDFADDYDPTNYDAESKRINEVAAEAKKLEDMTDAEFEKYLKKNGFTGMAAVARSRKRRLALKAKAERSKTD